MNNQLPQLWVLQVREYIHDEHQTTVVNALSQFLLVLFILTSSLLAENKFRIELYLVFKLLKKKIITVLVRFKI